MCRAIRIDGVDERRMCALDTSIHHDDDSCRQIVFVMCRRPAKISTASDDVAQQPIRRGEYTGREIDRVTNRNEKLLLDDIHHQVTENNLASPPATSPMAR